MSALEQPHISLAKYLEIERAAEFRSEYIDGDMLMMAGNTKEHIAIVGNIWAEFRAALRGRDCGTYGTEMRVKVDTDAYTYPDVAVACGEQVFLGDPFDTLTNPSVIIEVLSKTTEGYDRGQKFGRYRRMPSLRQYVLVAQNKVSVESYLRQPGEDWLLHEFDMLADTIPFPSLDCAISLSEIYYLVDFSRAMAR